MISRDRGFYIRFFSLMVPLVLQNIILFGVSLVDNVMIGRYNELSLSAVAAATQVQFVLQMLTGGVSAGVIVLGAQYWGQQRTAELKSIVGVGAKLQLLLALVFYLLVFGFAPGLMRLLTPDADVIREACSYLSIICYSYFFLCTTNILLASMQCVETVRIGFFATLCALVVNVGLNYVLIFGNLGAPRLGLRGAAIATLIARVVECGIILCYVLFVDKKLRLTLGDLVRRDFTFLGDYLRCGVPLILANLQWGVAVWIQVAILGRMGAMVLAANGIANTIFQIFAVANGAMSNAASILTGKTVGEGDWKGIRTNTATMQLLFLAIGLLSGTALLCSRGAVLSIYNISAETKALTNQFLLVLSIALMGACYQVPCLTGIVRGGGDTKFVLINDIIFQFFIVLPISAVAAFVFHLGPVPVFALLKSDQITKCLVAVVKVNRYRWIKTLTRA